MPFLLTPLLLTPLLLAVAVAAPRTGIDSIDARGLWRRFLRSRRGAGGVFRRRSRSSLRRQNDVGHHATPLRLLLAPLLRKSYE